MSALTPIATVVDMPKGRYAPNLKPRHRAGVPSAHVCTYAYLSAVETDWNVFFKLVPRPCTTAMIATEMPAAISPYSMAVAPDSSFAKRTASLFIRSSSSSIILTLTKVRTESVVLFIMLFVLLLSKPAHSKRQISLSIIQIRLVLQMRFDPAEMSLWVKSVASSDQT